MLKRIKTILSKQIELFELLCVSKDGKNLPLDGDGLDKLAQVTTMLCTIERTELEIAKRAPKARTTPRASHLTTDDLVSKHKKAK